MADPAVLAPLGSGVPSRAYQNVATGEITNYHQITNEVLAGGGLGNYRSVVSGVSINHLVSRFSPDECTPEFERVVDAAAGEIGGALSWFFDAAIPGYREWVPCDPSGASDPTVPGSDRVTQLLGSQPNPFNPRTTVRFQLAMAGHAALDVFEVSGRKVRSLVDGDREAGLHEVVWDGTNDRGTALPAGIYWTQLRTHHYRSSKRLVILP